MRSKPDGDDTSASELVHSRQHRQVMAEFGLKALERIDVDELLREACIHVARGLGVEHAKVLEYRAETDDLLVRAGVGWAEGVVGRARLPTDMSSPPGRALRTGEAVFIENLLETRGFIYSDLLRNHGVLSLVNVPIKTSDFTFGVLEADADEPRSFTDDDRNFLIGFANLVAAALQRQRADAERDRLMQELGKAKEAAEAAVASKDRVLAATSHDLRQPLQVITLCLERLAGDPSNTARQTDISWAKRAATRLARGLDYVLAVARLESGRLEPRIEPVDLDELLAELAEEYAPITEQRGLRLKVVSARTRIETDKHLLSHILQNLISNAVKYTDHGCILVGLRRRGSDRGLIEVHDTGIGIPADQLGKIFDEFHRLDTTRADGVGLGLSIVRRIADLLGHPLAVYSVPGKGSCFSVEVPLATRDKISK